MSTLARPTARVTIEPMALRPGRSRPHEVRVVIKLSPGDPRYADLGYVAGAARKALDGFAPAPGQPDERSFEDLSVPGRGGKAGSSKEVVIGVEGSVVWPDRPGDEAIEGLRAALVAEDYRVVLRGRRECGEAACLSDAVVDWDRPSDVPAGWYSEAICGRHNYRTCGECGSIYALCSSNSAGQAPSLTCEVCGLVLVGWGGSKLWSAELIRRGAAGD